MTYYGIVADIAKNDEDKTFVAKIILSNGNEISAKVSKALDIGDTVEVTFNGQDLTIKLANLYETTKKHSAKYGFLGEKNTGGKPFAIRETENSHYIGNVEAGHCSSSPSATITGYGITNYDYYDDTSKITKAINYTGIEGNVIVGTSLAKGFTFKAYIEKITDFSFLEIDDEQMKNDLVSQVSLNPFLINTIGVHGFLYLLASDIYKIELSGKGSLSQFLNLQPIQVKGQKLEVDLYNLANRLDENIDISKAFEGYMFLQPDNVNSTQVNTDYEPIKITLFGKKYLVLEVKIHTTNKIYHYYNEVKYDSAVTSFRARDYKLDIDNLYFTRGFFINPDTNKFTINNEQLTMNASHLTANVKSLKTFAVDEIRFQVGTKGILIDMNGASNI